MTLAGSDESPPIGFWLAKASGVRVVGAALDAALTAPVP
jgi:hypothetical protein